MAENNIFHFIVVDDSKLDCFIAEKVIKNTGKCASVKSFIHAKDAIAYFKEGSHPQEHNIILLVDIQMPVMNGFDFVDAFELLPLQDKARFKIFMISSSMNEQDVNRVHQYKSIRQLLNKPITSNNLSLLLANNQG